MDRRQTEQGINSGSILHTAVNFLQRSLRREEEADTTSTRQLSAEQNTTRSLTASSDGLAISARYAQSSKGSGKGSGEAPAPAPAGDTSSVATGPLGTDLSEGDQQEEEENIATKYLHQAFINGIKEVDEAAEGESLLLDEVREVKQALESVVDAGRDTASAALALGDLAITAQISGDVMSQDEADLITQFADQILTATDPVTENNDLQVVIELADTITESQEISSAEVEAFSQWTASVASGELDEVWADIALANTLFENGVEFSSIVDTYLPNSTAISSIVRLGGTLEEILALPVYDFELLAANSPAVNSLLDRGLTLPNTLLALQTGTPEEISPLVGADPADFPLFNTLLENGVEFTEFIHTFLPNASVMEGLVQLGVTGNEISELTACDFQLLAANLPTVCTLLDNDVSLAGVVNTYLPNIGAISRFIDQGLTLEQICALPVSDVEQLVANVPLVNALLDDQVSLAHIVSTYLPKAPALSALFDDLGITLADALPLPDAMVEFLLSEDPADIQASLGSGYTLAEHCEYSALLDLTVEQGQLTQAETQDAAFMAALKDNLANGVDPNDAVAVTRLGVRLAPYPNADTLIAEISNLSSEQISELSSLQEDELNQFARLAPDNLDLFHGLLDNGVGITDVATTFLPNASAISWIGKAGATMKEIAAMSADELQTLSDARGAGSILYGVDIGSPKDVDSAVPTQIMEFAGGAILVRGEATTDGGHVVPGYIVTQQANPEIYSQLREKYAAAQIDALRQAYGLPVGEDANPLDFSTTVPVNPEDPSVGFYTIGELAMQQTLDLAGTDAVGANKIAALQFALEARYALENGYDLLPYYERKDIWEGGTYEEFLGGAANPTTQELTQGDMADLLDEGAINQRIDELWADPNVQAAYNEQLNATVDKYFPDAEGYENWLVTKIESADYLGLINELKDLHLDTEAGEMINSDLAALAILNPEKAAEVGQMLMINAMGEQYLEIANDPAQVPPETYALATNDALAITLQALKSLSGVPRHAAQTLIDLIEGLTPEQVGKLSTITQYVASRVRSGSGGFDDAISRQINALPLDDNARWKLTKLVTEAQKVGVWGSIAGGGAAAAFVYKMTQGAWSADSTAMERWGAARDLLSVMYAGDHMGKYVANKCVAPEYVDEAKKFFGFADELPALWNPNFPSQANVANDYQGLSGAFQRVSDAWDRTGVHVAADAPEEVTSLLANLDAISQAHPSQQPFIRRVGLSLFKILTTFTEVPLGAGEMVVGGLTIKNAVQAGDTDMGFVGGFQMASGLATFGAGALKTYGMVTGATVSQFAGLAWAGPLSLFGTLLGIGAFIATVVINNHRMKEQHTELLNHTQQQTDWFTNLDRMGLLEQDWEAKLEYARTAFAVYGNDNTDSNRSYWDVQQAEFEHFKKTAEVAPDGLNKAPILNRLNWDLHLVSDTTLPNADGLLYESADPVASHSSATSWGNY